MLAVGLHRSACADNAALLTLLALTKTSIAGAERHVMDVSLCAQRLRYIDRIKASVLRAREQSLQVWAYKRLASQDDLKLMHEQLTAQRDRDLHVQRALTYEERAAGVLEDVAKIVRSELQEQRAQAELCADLETAAIAPGRHDVALSTDSRRERRGDGWNVSQSVSMSGSVQASDRGIGAVLDATEPCSSMAGASALFENDPVQ